LRGDVAFAGILSCQLAGLSESTRAGRPVLLKGSINVKAIQPVLPGSNMPEILLGERQDQYITLPAIRVTDDAESAVLTRWELSDDDKKVLANGGDVYLWVWTFGNPFQPVMLEVATPEMILSRAGDAKQLGESAEPAPASAISAG
jgi:hypothetical protein